MRITKQGWAIVDRDTHLGRWVDQAGRLDFDQSALGCYQHLFRKGDVLLNVGANIGCYASAFVDRASQVICMEPNAEALECLRHNLASHSNVIIHPFAASDREARCDVRCEGDNIGMAYVEETETGAVESRLVDSFGLDRVDFILMDCEGFEVRALEGAKETIRRCQPIMVIEVNDVTLTRAGFSRARLLAWLGSEGYFFRNIYGAQDLSDEQLDIICFPRHRQPEAIGWGYVSPWRRFRSWWTKSRRRIKNLLLGRG